MRALYIETSALARAYLHDDKRAHEDLTAALEAADVIVTSALTAVELRRAVAQVIASGRVQAGRAAVALRNALEVVARADVVPLHESVLARAGGPFPTPNRTLDAMHVATALEVQLQGQVADLVLLSRDNRVRDVAGAMGLQLA